MSLAHDQVVKARPLIPCAAPSDLIQITLQKFKAFYGVACQLSVGVPPSVLLSVTLLQPSGWLWLG